VTTVVLVHGWGYDAGVWDAVRTRLAPALRVATLDWGFFGAPVTVPPAPTSPQGAGRHAVAVPSMARDSAQPNTFPEPVIAVGHSLGALWWLAQADIPWRRLLCINGFPCFTEAADYAPAVAPRLLARMQAQFARDPAAVLADFHARCGGHAPAGAPEVERLAAGLAALATWDGRAALAARRADVFALAGTDDPIVPAAMSAMAFAGGHLATVDAPGHLLPLTHAELCAQWIERLAA
jgi:pimeloyl-ACP methyl ester carboxylesterase